MSCKRPVLWSFVTAAALWVGPVLGQAPDATKFNEQYESAISKAREDCAALWSDHVFDRLRTKFPLGEEKPTLPMLTNSERLQKKDKPVADLAIKVVEKCRAAYAPAFAMLPPQVSAMTQGLQKKQDALIADLYVGKITFGQYNVSMNRVTADLSSALSGIPQSPRTAPEPATAAVRAPPARKPNDQQPVKPTHPPPPTRLGACYRQRQLFEPFAPFECYK
jgi:hypothetical protein